MDSIQPLVSVSEIERCFGYNRSTIQQWERAGLIQEGVHFARPNKGHRRYSVSAMEDFVMQTSKELLNQKLEESNLLQAIAKNAKPIEGNQFLVPAALINAARKVLAG